MWSAPDLWDSRDSSVSSSLVTKCVEVDVRHLGHSNGSLSYKNNWKKTGWQGSFRVRGRTLMS